MNKLTVHATTTKWQLPSAKMTQYKDKPLQYMQSYLTSDDSGLLSEHKHNNREKNITQQRSNSGFQS